MVFLFFRLRGIEMLVSDLTLNQDVSELQLVHLFN